MVHFCNILTHLFHFVSEIGYLCLALQRKYRRVISVEGVPYAFGSARYRGFSFSYQMKGIIYIATNLFNGRSYIGQTRASLSRRKEQHIRDAVSDSVNHFHLALMQYGRDTFEWKILDEFEGTKEEVIHALNVAEEYHILKNRTMLDEYGYNATGGGYSSDKFADTIKKRASANYGGKAVLQYDLEGNFVREYESIADIKREFGVVHLQGSKLFGRIWRGYQWREKVNEYYPRKIEKHEIVSNPRTELVVYSFDGRLYKEYTSQSELRKEMGRGFTIREGFGKVSIKSNRQDTYIVFRKTIEDYPSKIDVEIIYPKSKNSKSTSCLHTTPVLQYSTDGKFIKEFKSIGDAYRETGVSKSNIRKSCKKSVPFSLDARTKYIWRNKQGEIKENIEISIAHRENIGQRYTKKKEHRVAQYDQNGDFIMVYETLSSASESTGVGVSIIRRCLKGIYFQGDVYQWMPFSESYKQTIGKMQYQMKNYTRIAQYDQNGMMIKVWENMYQAAMQTGESHNLIRKQCMGISTKKKTPSVWRYYSDYFTAS